MSEKKEYIEREALIAFVSKVRKNLPKDSKDFFTRDEMLLNFQQYVDIQPAADVVLIPETGIGDLSDGYHTFNELYHHRAVLFSALCNANPCKAWKSKRHDTGDMFDGMFIVGIDTENGSATYHYDVEPYWDMFRVKEVENAPKWDGHTPAEAISRISKFAADVEPVVRCVKCKYGNPLKAHADGVYGLHCAIGRGEEVRNVWHKYSKHYEDYSLVDVDGFCDQGEAGEPSMERSGSGE